MNKSVLFSSDSVQWATPSALYGTLNKQYQFDYDPCPLHGVDDGLLPLFNPWKGKRVFCNPPYGPGIEEWLKRGLEADRLFVVVELQPSFDKNNFCCITNCNIVKPFGVCA